jgi:GMP synthase (glutamine-hydrolysing)
MKTAIAIRHVHFEDLGTLEPLLHRRGYETYYCDLGAEELDAQQVDKADLLVVLGAPIGACDESAYPFLLRELKLIERRLDRRSPLLGICLGAQLMARVLGAAVAPMGHKEIGFSPLSLTAAGHLSPLEKLPENTAVLHWHGDEFQIPNGLESLATTALCPHQAFAVGDYALGLQFHLEADSQRIEQWLVGHAAELAQAGVDPGTLRAQAQAPGAQLRKAAEAVFDAWIGRMARSGRA